MDFTAIWGSNGGQRIPVFGVELGLGFDLGLVVRGTWYREGRERSGREMRIGLPLRDLVSAA